MSVAFLNIGMDSAANKRAGIVRGTNRRLSGMRDMDSMEEEKKDTAVQSWLASLADARENAAFGGKADGSDKAGASGKMNVLTDEDADSEEAEPADRGEAVKIYEAAMAGKENPLKNLRQAPKVPYGHLAKDGVIDYNGVIFVCDEKTNSICLGDMSDPKEVITVTLSGGGHLKVNRDSIGLLSKAAGMFSPKDLNLIMRAIAKDTKIQSVKQEIEDEEGRLGKELAANS